MDGQPSWCQWWDGPDHTWDNPSRGLETLQNCKKVLSIIISTFSQLGASILKYQSLSQIIAQTQSLRGGELSRWSPAWPGVRDILPRPKLDQATVYVIGWALTGCLASRRAWSVSVPGALTFPIASPMGGQGQCAGANTAAANWATMRLSNNRR